MDLKSLACTALTVTLALSGLSPQAQAEDIQLPLAAELIGQDDLYTVELLLFRQASPALNEEFWPERPLPDFSDAHTPLATDGMPLSLLEELPKTLYALNDEANRLARQGYQILYHQSWLEQFAPNQRSKLLLVDPLGSYEGTVRIERQRYLHVYPDITYYTASGGEQMAPTLNFREERRMRSEELHYIDHPVLGMLVLFRPVASDAAQ